jgi:hypothetical protein
MRAEIETCPHCKKETKVIYDEQILNNYSEKPVLRLCPICNKKPEARLLAEEFGLEILKPIYRVTTIVTINLTAETKDQLDQTIASVSTAARNTLSEAYRKQGIKFKLVTASSKPEEFREI